MGLWRIEVETSPQDSLVYPLSTRGHCFCAPQISLHENRNTDYELRRVGIL